MNHATRSVFVVFAAVSAFGLAACDDHRERDVRESEPRETETRDLTHDLGQFSSINLRGAAELKIAVGAPESVKVEGSERTVSRLRTEVRNNTLYIVSKRKGFSWLGDRDDLTLSITLPKLESFQSNGAGNIELTGLNGGEQVVRVAGAHNIEASGELDKLTIELEGAGNIDYGRVAAKNADVTVSGAGHVLVQVSDVLSATMNGVGAIHYEGNPQRVESKLHGIGSISKR